MRASARRRLGSLARTAGTLVLGSLPVAASAQSAIQPAPTREEVLRQEIDRQLREGSEAIDASAAFARAPCPLADPKFSAIELTLASVVFAGAEGVEPGLLDAAWRGYAGQEIAVATICDIRDRAATLLRDAGYVASVQVPVQTIESGTVRFEVVVARLVSFVIRGDTGRSGPMVERYLAPLREEGVFDTRAAERALLLARRIPGMDVRMTLARASGAEARPGDLVGVVDVIDQRFEADLALQNYGSNQVGPWGAQARVRVNGLTGLADRTELSGFATADFDEQLVVQGRHEFAIGGSGLRTGVNAVHAWTRPDVPGADVFFARTLVVNAYATYPLLLRQAHSLDLTGGLDIVDQRIEFSDQPFSKDKLRVLTLALERRETDPASVAGENGFSISEPRWASRGRIELRKGIAGLGASGDCGPALAACAAPGAVPISRLDADPQGFLVRGDAEVAFRPSPLITLTGRPRFQWSDDNLLPYEQFSGGNYSVGRGYDPGAATGDRGFGAQAEVAVGSLEPRSPTGSALQGFAFYDSFNAWFADAPGVRNLNSVGGGARLNFRRRAYAEVLAAVPLEAAPLATRTGNIRILFNLAVRLGG
ncbi:MAG: ShlB/FhaC/HecB family hemolysin secretion/activation protein [Qipengyuania sp.]|nr:ShlB/FhaC/HecB family hemolysin secretion/activation protein [Qipengyuania sp.]